MTTGPRPEHLASPVLSAKLRRRRGVYATPPALVRFIVRAVDVLLREKLGKPLGLADPGVLLLDPAAGPANFLAEVWSQALDRHRKSGGDECELLRAHLVPHIQGFELLAEQHAAGVAVLARYLERLGERDGDLAPALHLADSLAPSPELVAQPWNVVLGNPPWNGHSANLGTACRELMEGYERPDGTRDEGFYTVDGEPLGERNSKWLGADQVKFLRLAQWRIDQTGEGLVAFVLTHSLLDSPTYRGLRRSLLQSFEEVWALDLHGAYRRGGGLGGFDDNVFPRVTVGAAVLFLVKRRGLPRRVLRADLRGFRDDKLAALDQGDLGSFAWTEVEPEAPGYLFVRGDRSREREYRQGIPLPEILPIHSCGLLTGRDRWALGWTERPSCASWRRCASSLYPRCTGA